MLRVVATDGGLVPAPWDTERLLIAPGERYDVMFVAAGDPGDRLTFWNGPYERGHGTGADEPMVLATVIFEGDAPLTGRTLPEAFPAIEALPVTAPDFQLELDEAYQGGDLVFTINGKTWPNVPDLAVPLGSIRTLEISNVSDKDHPFHQHGFFFQARSSAGASPLIWKDTVIVRSGSKLELVSRYDELGHWMYQCHILEHAEGGMMGAITVH